MVTAILSTGPIFAGRFPGVICPEQVPWVENGVFYDPSRHHRHSIRLRGYDYSRPGAYFITFNTWHWVPLLGQVERGRIRLTRHGRIVVRIWEELPRHYAVTLDAFVVMPDHVHGILILPDRLSTGDSLVTSGPPVPVTEIVRSLKSFSARQINESRGTPGSPVWQRGYYDRIIRDRNALNRIRRYILRNPERAGLNGRVYDPPLP